MARGRSAAGSGEARTARLADRFEPQLATLVRTPPEGDEWLHELKYDGYRIGCRLDGRNVSLVSRNGKDWTDRFPDVCAAAAELPVRRALLDGEVAVLLPDGRTSFQALQNVFSGGERANLVYFVFDLLHVDGEDVARLPLEQRKTRLAALLRSAAQKRLRYSEHVVGRGAEFLAHACRMGLEGIVSKRRDRPYTPGRGAAWLKTKCIKRQEFVVGGFTDPEGSRLGIGALLVGVRVADGTLAFAGKVGTGFTNRGAQELRRTLDGIEQAECPFTPTPPGSLGRHAHWVKPTLVAEVAFTEWTSDGKIRHPSFQGLRDDKPVSDVRREKPVPPPRGTATVAGARLTHPDRVLWPELGFTKLDLARFYETIADRILPHVQRRPLTLVRCPGGVGTPCFYMKHSPAWAADGLQRVRIREKKKIGEYLIVDSLTALIGLVQMDVLEIHTWNSTIGHVEEPDRLVLDLDPGPEVRWTQVIEAARLVRSAFEALKLQSFVKTTGSAGLHVVVPLVPEAGWSECLSLARGIAEAIERQSPRLYTTAFPKAGRERKILIDYLRNNRTNTSVAAFSTRATPRAPVSVPLAWEELSTRLRSDHFTVRNLGKRLSGSKDDPWRAYWRCRQRIAPELLRAIAER
ncbi:MAG: DNA ligase D [Deltaproteobacteria bacterium]|nr:MAG: DNA ligase D [Deltaproteobacteria bacterium]